MAFFTNDNYTMGTIEHKWGGHYGKVDRFMIWGWTKGKMQANGRKSEAMVSADLYNSENPEHGLELQLTPREARQLARELVRLADVADKGQPSKYDSSAPDRGVIEGTIRSA